MRATREAADCLANRITKEYAVYHRNDIELVHEMFCVMVFGLADLVKMNPQIEDDVPMKVIGQALRPTWRRVREGELFCFRKVFLHERGGGMCGSARSLPVHAIEVTES